jgi:hypothetical protein
MIHTDVLLKHWVWEFDQTGSCASSLLLLLQTYTLRALTVAEYVALLRTIGIWFSGALVANLKVVLSRPRTSVVHIKITKIVAHGGRSLSFECFTGVVRRARQNSVSTIGERYLLYKAYSFSLETCRF